MSRSDKISTSGGDSLGHNPFGALGGLNLPSGPTQNAPKSSPASSQTPPERNRGRVDISRQTAGRGGKTVTVVSGFTGIGLPEKESLAKQMQKACGAGGTVKEGRIEIQGDKREAAAEVLRKAGFRPVMAGG